MENTNLDLFVQIGILIILHGMIGVEVTDVVNVGMNYIDLGLQAQIGKAVFHVTPIVMLGLIKNIKRISKNEMEINV